MKIKLKLFLILFISLFIFSGNYPSQIFSSNYLQKTTNQNDWKFYGLEDFNINKLLILDGILFASTESNGLWKKNTIVEDSEWEFIGFSDTSSMPGPVSDLYLQKSSIPKIYVGLTHNNPELPSTFVSADLGLSWAPLSYEGMLQSSKGSTVSITASNININTLFIVSGSLYRSTNAGESWEIVKEANIKKVFILPTIEENSEIIWIRESSTLGFNIYGAYSTDYGNNWVIQFPPPGGAGTNWALSVIERITHTNYLFAGASYIWKCSDNGENWEISLDRPLDYAGILIDPLNHNHIIAAGGRSLNFKSNLFESVDGGNTWDSLFTFPDTLGFSALTWDPDRRIIFGGARKNWGSLPDGLGGVFFLQLPTTSTNNKQVMYLNYNLSQNYPNPFNPVTTIKYQIPTDGFVTLKVYDVLGKEVALLEKQHRMAGSYTVNFDASNLSSGIYIYEIRVNDFVQQRKMMVLK